MNHKRTMLISTVAVLVVILGAAGFLAYTRSTENPQPIPVTGRSNSGGSQPNQFESAEQIDAQQAQQSLKVQQPQAARINVNSQWVPGQEYMQGQPGLQALKNQQFQVANPNVDSQWVPGQEYIRGQPDRYISPQEYEQRQFSK